MKDKHIKMYTNNKTLSKGTGNNAGSISDTYNDNDAWANDVIYGPVISEDDFDLYD